MAWYMDPLDDPALTTRPASNAFIWLTIILAALLVGAGVFYAGWHFGHEVGWKAGYDYGRPDPKHG